MQIVRDLGRLYAWDEAIWCVVPCRRKKASVMEQERQNFVYGNEEEGVPGCIANGIDEKIANKIYDEMMDFAKYAFNKSHAAAYAVVAYQTAWLKYYYPVEFMASLMTSVMDNSTKVSEYITDLSENEYQRYCHRISTKEKADFLLREMRSAMDCLRSKAWEGLSLRQSLQKEKPMEHFPIWRISAAV